ncbi:hypothetical protein FT663_02956 [Candidozyma haemuli var. vulneris]|uniref:Nab2 type CCCH zinc finger 4 domain-containing protein n=1 Tax=Candidozyma haemuli TaxID=45357 RepID=A0A2V1AN12_9ASCO|nr:hypothetical protein CXQ85_001553 [[Candida] haemuloni]KAF3990883.1 hypothetical protein FT663_02956 [[Candida] haemuloni var. vulneris]KAF3992777.1 hypothetical protein FT662_00986 [[Candida] haemuloni var. vulneris]PVH19248.1 hypothetical protein CXQ85_001553 [[Candida] haemuloni]
MFDPKGPIAQQLTPLLVTELTSKYQIADDAKDVAEYIIMLIGNGRPANEIVAEVKEIVTIPIDETFIGTVFAEIGRLESLNAQDSSAAPAPAPAPAAATPTGPAGAPRGPAATRNVKFQKGVEGRGKFGAVTKPRVTRGSAGVSKGSKDFVSKTHSKRDALPVKTRGQPSAQEKKLLEQIQQHMPALLAAKPSGPPAVRVQMCKYGAICSKEMCPFGHPTPANKDAKPIVPKWCHSNKECTNGQCVFAHSSPNYKAPAKPTGSRRRPATSLEQCKFNNGCSNKYCGRRHATSLVACQRGNDCTMPGCTFNHIIEEECRHKNDCANKVCYFKHPDAREVTLLKKNTGGAPAEGTDERAFAVPDDQVMEQAVQ